MKVELKPEPDAAARRAIEVALAAMAARTHPAYTSRWRALGIRESARREPR